MIINKMASSADPDEMAHYESSHLDLHCTGICTDLQASRKHTYII